MNCEMVYNIIATDDFERQLRRLGKKYASIPHDYATFLEELLNNPEMGDKLGGNTRKIRMAITSKGKGKRGGARVITCNVLVSVENTDIYLLTIYDKGEQDSITENEIRKLKKHNGLL